MPQQTKKKYLSRADIVCRIFMDKAEEFIKDLCEKNVLGRVAGWCYSVEHQKRGWIFKHMILFVSLPIIMFHFNFYFAA